MALTKEFEYDCEVRGPYKAVQVRKATIVKDDGTEISRTYDRHTLQCRTKTGLTYNEDGTVDNAGGATPTSLARMPAYRRCATPCGRLRSNLLMRHLRTARRYRCADGNVIDDVLERPLDAGDRASVLGVSVVIGEVKRIDILLNRTREDYATRSELKEDMQQVLQALHRVEDKLTECWGATDVEILTVFVLYVFLMAARSQTRLYSTTFMNARFAKVIHSQGGKICVLPT